MESEAAGEKPVVRELEGGGTIQTWKDRMQQKQKNRGTEKGRDQKGKPRERQKKDFEVLQRH